MKSNCCYVMEKFIFCLRILIAQYCCFCNFWRICGVSLLSSQYHEIDSRYGKNEVKNYNKSNYFNNHWNWWKAWRSTINEMIYKQFDSWILMCNVITIFRFIRMENCRKTWIGKMKKRCFNGSRSITRL